MVPLHQPIGRSLQDRPLVVQHRGSASAHTRVFLIAGQHGDEPLAREATKLFLDSHSDYDIQVAALIDANPDGSHRNQRRNAMGVDLNRDHQRLAAPETAAIHAFARSWQPHLIVDVHTYPPRRKHLLKQGLVHANDVFIDIANNPTACVQSPWAKWLRTSLRPWIDSVRAGGFRCDRYTIITRKCRVRHSTPDVVDARNGLALACNVPTVLLEGREPTRFDGEDAKQRTVAGLVTALREIVASSSRANAFAPGTPPTDIALPIRSRYVEDSQRHELDFYDKQHKSIRPVRLPGPYLSRIKVTRRTIPPAVYETSTSNLELLELLHRHGVAYEPHPQRDEQMTIPVTASNARLLAVLLEPRSKYSLNRNRPVKHRA